MRSHNGLTRTLLLSVGMLLGTGLLGCSSDVAESDPPGGPFQGFDPVETYETCEGQVCTLVNVAGCTQPGKIFSDYGSCEDVLTQRPNSGIGTVGTRQVAENPETANDPDLAWSIEQVNACGCICCHSSKLEGPGSYTWDIDFGPVWTDSANDRAIGILAGLVDSSVFGAIEPEMNNGFDRALTGLPTTDPERLRKFFQRELDRRGADVSNEPPVGGGYIPE